MAQRSNFQIDDIKINKRGNAFFMDIDATLDEPNCRTAFKDWLDSEYKETEIDWDKVPVDTPVFVWGDNRKTLKEDIFRLMKSDSLYETFDNGATSWTACTTSRWKHCELAKVEDKQKYAKGVEY